MPAKLENSAVITGLEKISFHSNSKERQCQRMSKLPHNCTHSHTSKVMLKTLQVRLQQFVNRELPDIQIGFRKGRGTRDQIANICWIIKKAREFQKNIYFCFIDFPGGASDKEPACQCGRPKRHGFHPQVGRISWRRAKQPTPVFLPRVSHGQKSLVGYSLYRVAKSWTGLKRHSTQSL